MWAFGLMLVTNKSGMIKSYRSVSPMSVSDYFSVTETPSSYMSIVEYTNVHGVPFSLV